MSTSLAAREAGITASQLFQWRKAHTEGSVPDVKGITLKALYEPASR